MRRPRERRPPTGCGDSSAPFAVPNGPYLNQYPATSPIMVNAVFSKLSG